MTPGSWRRPEVHAPQVAFTDLRRWSAECCGHRVPGVPAFRPSPAPPPPIPCPAARRREEGLAHLRALRGHARVVPRRGAAVVIHEERPSGLRVDLDLPARGQGVAIAGAVAGRRLHHRRVGGSAHAGSGSARRGGRRGAESRGAGSRDAGPQGAESLAGRGRSKSRARRRRVREAGAGHLYELKEGVTWPERGGSVWK